ncbi:unnamed protein product, partial [Adineta steineri]
MEGETAVVSTGDIEHKRNISSPFNPNYSHQQSRTTPTNIHSNTNISISKRGLSAEERHTLPEIPRNPLTA